MKEMIKWLNGIPWATRPKGMKWSESPRSGYFWWRTMWHLIGGLIIGLIAFAISFIPGAYPFSFAVLGASLTGVIYWKELSERQPRSKTIIDTTAWLLGFLIIALSTNAVFAQTNCRRHDCSDDTTGVWGNEWITHDPAPEWTEPPIFPTTKRCYEYALWDIPLDAYTHVQKNCDGYLTDDEGNVRYLPPRPGFSPYKNFQPIYLITYNFVVRLCLNDSLCGPWLPFLNDTEDDGPDYIGLTGGKYVCWGSDSQGACELMCYPSAPLWYYGQIRECEE